MLTPDNQNLKVTFHEKSGACFSVMTCIYVCINVRCVCVLYVCMYDADDDDNANAVNSII